MNNAEKPNLDLIASENQRALGEPSPQEIEAALDNTPLPEEITGGLEVALADNKEKSEIAAAATEAAKNVVDTDKVTPEIVDSMIGAYIDELAKTLERGGLDSQTAESHARKYLALAIERGYGNHQGVAEIYEGVDELVAKITENPDSIRLLADELDAKSN